MKVPIVRTAAFALGAAVLLIVLAYALLPVIASTQLVRDRIALELSALTGQRVMLGGDPDITVWPRFGASLADVSLVDWQGDSARPRLTADRIEVDLSPVSALRGSARFSSIRLFGPVLRLPLDAIQSGPASVSLGGGRVLGALQWARDERARNPSAPDFSTVSSIEIGRVEIVDGRVELMSPHGVSELASNIEGSLSWPSLGRPLAAKLSGVWRGEVFSVEADSSNPLLVAAGGNGPVRLAVRASPLQGSFEGNATLGGDMFCDGKVGVASPSLRRALEWSGREIKAGSSVGAVSLAGRLICTGKRLRFEEAQIAVGGNSGRGVLEAGLGDAMPSVSGTLAFETLDLRSFLSAFVPLGHQGAEPSGRIDTSFTEQIKLDLRLSAASAIAGGVTLSTVAAAAQVKDGLAVFDISDATVFGGSIQTSIRMDRVDETSSNVELRLSGSDIDGAAASAAMALSPMVPRARGSFSVILRGKGDTWSTLLDRADGSITARFGAGAINGVDMASFREKLKQGDFFSLAEMPRMSIPLDGAQVKATVSNGTARIETAEAQAKDFAVKLNGVIPYMGGGLAMSGRISPKVPETPEVDDEDAMFFVGGSWSDPFVSPMTYWGEPR